MDLLKDSIAIVGIACRFPGASSKDEFWQNLVNNKETIKNFTDDELKDFELQFDTIKNDPNFIKSRGVLGNIEFWDEKFFNVLPNEARIIDPQHRIWLENTWHAFEDAGLNPYTYEGNIGVFAGSFFNTYLLNNVLRDPLQYEQYLRGRTPEMFQAYINNDPMFLATKTAYHFNLKGAAVNIQTACSTSLVAVAQACSSLLSFESDVCVAGGVTVIVPQETGYMYQEGAIGSSDGHCKPFDVNSSGTVFGNGVGTVILKRLEDAVNDNDRVYAIIRGWATNNDGNQKIGFAAPGIEGQYQVISAAHRFSQISANEIQYVEAHGTATPLGDPIEVKALTKAFRDSTTEKQFCGIGSLKSNVGHLDVAAGVAGLIKIALSAYHKIVPATLHFTSPNRLIDFENSPFYVQSKNLEWKQSKPLIMGVSSFGVGGTNAHVIVSDFTVPQGKTESSKPKILLLSAKSKESVDMMTRSVSDHCNSNKNLNYSNLSYTLINRRASMDFRSSAVVSQGQVITENTFSSSLKALNSPELVFMFPGQGAQYPGMGKQLYDTESLFRKHADECFQLYFSITGKDLKSIIFSNSTENSSEILSRTEYTQPSLFVIEYCTAQLLMSYGLEPQYLIGHSIGEYVAACISGVFTLEAALKAVIKRGELMQSMPGGKMMAVLTEAKNLEIIKSDLFEIAADNSHNSCSIAYHIENEKRITDLLEKNNFNYIPLQTSHAFHSKDFNPILNEFESFISTLALNSPQIPFISCVSGKIIEAKDACSPNYWAKQLRNTVHFKDGISTLATDNTVVFLEVGPNTHLSGIVKQNSNITDKTIVVESISKASEKNEQIKIYECLAELWKRGLEPDFTFLFENESPQITDLPPYPFIKNRHWVDFKLGQKNLTQTGTEIISETSVHRTETSVEKKSDKRPIEIITSIWKEVLGKESIAITDNFLEIGGHSLLALQLLVRIKENFGITIGLRDFLNKPTIENLHEVIQKNSNLTGKNNQKSEFIHLTQTEKLPITDTQKRLFFISKLNNESPAYNIPFTIKYSGEFNSEIFKKVLQHLVKSNKILTANFYSLEDGVYCKISNKEIEVQEFDLSDLTESLAINRLHEIVKNDSRKVFDLENDTLYRFSLIKTKEREIYFHATINHIVFDGISCNIFVNQLHELYTTFQSNGIDKTELPKFHQFDFAHWEQQNLDLDATKESSKYWKEQLSGLEPLISFPTDRIRKKTPSGFGMKEKIVFSELATKKIREISKNKNLTVFQTVLSSFGLLIQKYTNSNDFCIGSPIAHRPHRNLENQMGMFVNTISLRFNFDNIQSFDDLLQYTKNMTIDAISHQDLSFDKVVELMQLERHTLYNPIFQIALSWQNFPLDTFRYNNLEGKIVTMPDGISPFDLTFYMWENHENIEGEIEFNIDIFDLETIKRLKENFLCMIEAICKNSDTPLSLIDFVSPEQKQQISIWNNTDITYENNVCIHKKIEYKAQQTPDATALYWGDKKFSYKDFNSHANKLAHYLISEGVKPDRIVAVCIERCPEMMIAIYAILKAGGAYLPIDPAIPEDRLRIVANDAEPVLILTTTNSSKNIPKDINYKVIKLDSILESPFTQNSSNPETTVHSGNLAYIIYTSGSTGIPKGVMIEHHSVLNRIGWMQAAYPITEKDILIQKTPTSFDVSVWELFWWSFEGAGLLVLPPGAEKDSEQLVEAINKYKVSIIHFVPSMFGVFCPYIESAKKQSQLDSLRTVFLSGEAFPVGMVNDFYQTMEGFNSPDLINLYGPTEATVDVSHFRCPRTTQLETMYIGKPIYNTKLLVINSQNQILPVGVPGELIITGVNLSRGYLKRDELNKEKFIDITYFDGKVIRAYKTGDLVSISPDGNIFYIGRIDNQVKIRGYRIELGEIEADLTDIEEITEAVVLAGEFGMGTVQLIAYVKTPNVSAFSEKSVKEHLSSLLPAYMVPNYIIALEEFPLSPNGKIDRKKLSANVKNHIDTKKVAVQPVVKSQLSQTEKAIFQIWEEILKNSNFGIDDNFFNVGGNSLIAIPLVEKVKKTFGLQLGLRVFFDDPTIRNFSGTIDLMLIDQQNKGETITTNSSNIISGEI